MAPPRTPDFDDGPGPSVDEYDWLCDEVARTQGVINVAEARLVELARRGIGIGVSGGSSLSPARWVAWRAGVAPERAAAIVKVAERAGELPHTMAAFTAGQLTLDQAAVVARYVPGRYDESAARVASCCTVKQLRQALPWYADTKPDKPTPDPDDPDARGSVSSGYDEHGYYLRARLPEAAGAVVDQALKAVHEDLKRQARADCPEGQEPQRVYAADALVALAEAALAAGEAVRPGTDRYLVHVHLEAGPNGVQLATHLGIVVPEGQRRRILCDARLRGLVRDGGAPLSSGRTTRDINRRMRRAIEHRDRSCCTVPGCGRSTGLEIHHIVHWEDGGPTDTANLILLCAHHHTTHHQGTLGIDGNADHPRHQAPGVVFTNQWGRPLDPTGQPTPPTPPAPGTTPTEHLRTTAAGTGLAAPTYVPPTGERLDPWGFHLNEDPNWTDPTAPSPEDAPPDDGDEPPPPRITGQRPPAAPPTPTGPQGDTPIDPTRAGPDAA